MGNLGNIWLQIAWASTGLEELQNGW
jgi:hypothetical protein